MDSSKKGKKTNPKKGKTLIKFINKSDSDSESSEHELSYYVNDRVKLMKEVLKIINPKKIKSMAPDWMKDLDIEEINSMLLEELLGISNKRLKCIFNGEKLEEDSSSTEDEQKPVDVISLDDITDDDFVIDLASDSSGEHKKHSKGKVKDEPKRKKIKKEKHVKNDLQTAKVPDKEKTDEENLMSVLELLELQARARAIRSQLALESKKKEQPKENNDPKIDDSDNEAVIIESPKDIEIVITSSDSENENSEKSKPKRYDTQHITSKGDTDKETGKRSQQSVTQNQEIVIENPNLNTNNSHKIDTNETEQSINTGGKNIYDNLNQEGNNEFENHISNNTEDISNSITESGENIDINKESENLSKCTEQREGAPEQINEKILTNEETIASENLTQIHNTNGSKPTISEGDKAVDKSFKKITKKSRKRHLRTPNDNNSGSETEESLVMRKQESTEHKTESGSVVTEKDQNVNNGVEHNNGVDESDGIVINVDQSEIEYIVSD